MNYPTKIFVRNENGGVHVETVDNPALNSLSPVLIGYYEARNFYKPKFHTPVDRKDYYGTYFWQADVRTDTDGEGLINYNLQKQPSGKIRIEGITNSGIPFAVKLK
jgi:hypothetical protein